MLELGSGSGRLLTALADPTRDTWGLELDASLLALGRRVVAQLPQASRRRVKLVQGNMERLELPRRFERVLLPYNGFYCLLSSRAAQRCLRRVHDALEPGGIFAFDVWNAEPIHEAGVAAAAGEDERLRIMDGAQAWRVIERCRVGRGAQRLDVTYCYARGAGPAEREQLIRQRYYRLDELLTLLAETGLRVQKLAGNFAGGRLTPQAARVVVTAVRP